ncbi:unnamed protein product [Ixodes persulcatus]
MPGCCVLKCSNNSRNGWRLFSIPTNAKRKRLWLTQIKRDNWEPTRSSSVCSVSSSSAYVRDSLGNVALCLAAAPKRRKPPKPRCVLPPAPESKKNSCQVATARHEDMDQCPSSPPTPALPSTDVASASAGHDTPGPYQYHPAGGTAMCSTGICGTQKQLADVTRKYASLLKSPEGQRDYQKPEEKGRCTQKGTPEPQGRFEVS